MKWYVLNYDFNKKEIYTFNIFNSYTFVLDLQRAYHELAYPFSNDFDKFKERLDHALKYAFWCKSEYEIMVSSLFNDANTKVDVYSQVKPNLDALADYIAEHEYELVTELFSKLSK